METKEEILKYYKGCFKCKFCNHYYGSDLNEKTLICHECELKLIREQKKLKDDN